MELALHTIKPASGATRKKKRVGRGNASGHGTYSTRGLKGQRSRTGGRNKLKRLGFKKILQSLPKNRGFKSDKPKYQIINLSQINQCFSDGAKINLTGLLKAGLIDTIKAPVKLLNTGELDRKNLTLENIKVSQKVKEQLDKLGGKVIAG